MYKKLGVFGISVFVAVFGLVVATRQAEAENRNLNFSAMSAPEAGSIFFNYSTIDFFKTAEPSAPFFATTVQTFTTPGTFNWVAPAGVTSITIELWGGGGGGGGDANLG